MAEAALALSVLAAFLAIGAVGLAVALLWRQQSFAPQEQLNDLAAEMRGRIEGGLDATEDEIASLRNQVQSLAGRLDVLEGDLGASMRAIVEDLHGVAEWLSSIEDRTKVLEEGGVIMPKRAADDDD